MDASAAKIDDVLEPLKSPPPENNFVDPTPGLARIFIVNPSDWQAVPPKAPVRQTQRVRWEAMHADTLRLELPADVFENLYYEARNVAIADVRQGAPRGLRWYNAWADGKPVRGESSPGVIVD